jgi:hypothetical protein
MSVVIGEVAVTMGSQSASIVNMTIQKHVDPRLRAANVTGCSGTIISHQ